MNNLQREGDKEVVGEERKTPRKEGEILRMKHTTLTGNPQEEMRAPVDNLRGREENSKKRRRDSSDETYHTNRKSARRNESSSRQSARKRGKLQEKKERFFG